MRNLKVTHRTEYLTRAEETYQHAIETQNYLTKLITDNEQLKPDLEWDIDDVRKMVAEAKLYLEKAQEEAYTLVPYEHERVDRLVELIEAMRRDYPLN